MTCERARELLPAFRARPHLLESQRRRSLRAHSILMSCHADIYSLRDVEEVAKGGYGAAVARLATELRAHIEGCVSCRGKGFVCPGCRGRREIFPFQENTTRCLQCKALFHASCFPPGRCPACPIRAQVRCLGGEKRRGLAAYLSLQESGLASRKQPRSPV